MSWRFEVSFAGRICRHLWSRFYGDVCELTLYSRFALYKYPKSERYPDRVAGVSQQKVPPIGKRAMEAGCAD